MEKNNQNFKKQRNQNNYYQQPQYVQKGQASSNNMQVNNQNQQSVISQNNVVYVPQNPNNYQQTNSHPKQFNQGGDQFKQKMPDLFQQLNFQWVKKDNFNQDTQGHKYHQTDKSQVHQKQNYEQNNGHQNMNGKFGKQEGNINQKPNNTQDIPNDKNKKYKDNKKNKRNDNKNDRCKVPKELQNIYQKEHDKYLKKLQQQNNQELYWLCKTCQNKNCWRTDKSCYVCKDAKNRPYERMRTDVGLKDYDYLFFIDYECNSHPRDGFEIIEFPIQVVDVQKKEIINSFSTYVKPTSPITKFIQKLTNISNQHVQNAPFLETVLQQVNNFLQPYLEKGLDRCCVVYDCDSDASFLNNETIKKKIYVPPILQKYIILKNTFPAHITYPPSIPPSLSKMLEAFKMDFEGQKHCGLDDCYNQARVGIRLFKEGYYFSKKQENKLGEKIQKLNQKSLIPIEYFIQIEFDLSRVDENKEEQVKEVGQNNILDLLSNLSLEINSQNSNVSQDSNAKKQNENKSEENQFFTLQAGKNKVAKIICSVSQIQNQQIKVIGDEQSIWEFEIPEIGKNDAKSFMKQLFNSLFMKLEGMNLNNNRFVVLTCQPMYRMLMNQALFTLSNTYEKDQETTFIFENVKKYLSHYISISQYVSEIISSANKNIQKNLEKEVEQPLNDIYKSRCSKTNIKDCQTLVNNLLKECKSKINVGSMINL